MAFSQISNPLEPTKPKKPKEMGIMVGIGYNFQSGTSYVSCPDCEFDNGRKFGYSIGLKYEDYIDDNLFKYGISLIYENMSLEASFKEREAFEYEKDRFIGINFRNESFLNTNYLSLQPYLKFYPTSNIFLILSPTLNYVLNNRIIHEKIILDNNVLLPNGEIVYVSFSDTKSTKKLIENDDYRDVSKIQYGVNSTVGVEFLLDSDVIFSPQFSYYYPISEYSSYGDNFKIFNWRIFFELRIKV